MEESITQGALGRKEEEGNDGIGHVDKHISPFVFRNANIFCHYIMEQSVKYQIVTHAKVR